MVTRALPSVLWQGTNAELFLAWPPEHLCTWRKFQVSQRRLGSGDSCVLGRPREGVRSEVTLGKKAVCCSAEYTGEGRGVANLVKKKKKGRGRKDKEKS